MAARRKSDRFLTSKGHRADSTFEKVVLEDLISRGVKFEYEPNSISYYTRVKRGYCPQCGSEVVYQRRSYTPDLRLANGVYVEIKGKLAPSHRTLLGAFVKQHPECDLRFLFQRNNPYGGRVPRRRYCDWAIDLGCPAAVGVRVPDEWTLPNALRSNRARTLKPCDSSENLPKPAKASSPASVSRASGGSVKTAGDTGILSRALRSLKRPPKAKGGRSKPRRKGRGARGVKV